MSEFGAGIIVCLAKFSEHLHHDIINKYQKDFDNFSSNLELIMNGASDHFYDLDRDRSPQSLLELADLSLAIGHGFTGKTWTEADLKRIRFLWQRSCEELDIKLGTNPDWGAW